MGELIDYGTFFAARNKPPVEPADPHFVIVGDDGVHAIPVSVFEKVANGEMKFTDIDAWDQLIPAIVRDWLRFKVQGAM